MEIVLSKGSVKFLEKLSAKEAERIREKLANLLQSIDSEGIVPFNEMDIKSLKGEWQGFLRMRVGKIRIVFRIDAEADELQVYDIDFRGNIYKSLLLPEPAKTRVDDRATRASIRGNGGMRKGDRLLITQA